jgi:hypothetical protein
MQMITMKKQWLLAGAALIAGLAVHGATHFGPLSPADFVRKVDQLNAAYDRIATDRKVTVSDAERTELLKKADQVCAGIAFFYKDEPVEIGQKEIDWFGGQKKHQEWIAQLNRFAMLYPLIAAYRQTPDEKYAVRAKELMNDWFDFWAKHEYKFIDPQKNNELNTSIRIRNWITALAVFRNSAAFDDAFVDRAIAMLARQTDLLTDRTKPGDSNWQIAQAHALLEAGIVFDFLPESARWRAKGAEVLNACFQRQFRADGSHLENTTGYHAWMVEVMVSAHAIAQIRPDLALATDPAITEKALQFTQLSRPFAFNDSSYLSSFPKWTPADLAKPAARGGVKDWRPQTAGVFRDAGLVFGGNDREKFFFDAGKFCGWHTHLSRLTFEFGVDGYSLLVDPAISTYERKDAHYAYGRTTYSHATVNFNGAHQVRQNAELIDAVLSDRFGVAVGEFNGGAFQGPFADKYQANVAADMQRALLWLDRDYLLVFDRTQVKSAPDGRAVTTYVFPAAPMEKWTLLAEKAAWHSVNAKRPNLLIQMLLKPAAEFEARCVEGQKEPELRGWMGLSRTGMTASPTVEFAAATGFEPAAAVTLVAAFAPGAAAPLAEVTHAEPGRIDFQRPGGAVDQLRYQVDFRRTGELTAGPVTADATLLLVRAGRIFVYRAQRVSVAGKSVPLPAPGFTGWLD